MHTCKEPEVNIVGIVVVTIAVVTVFFIAFYLSSCTLSLQNISSNGKTKDVVDQQQNADGEVSPTVNIPAI